MLSPLFFFPSRELSSPDRAPRRHQAGETLPPLSCYSFSTDEGRRALSEQLSFAPEAFFALLSFGGKSFWQGAASALGNDLLAARESALRSICSPSRAPLSSEFLPRAPFLGREFAPASAVFRIGGFLASPCGMEIHFSQFQRTFFFA